MDDFIDRFFVAMIVLFVAVVMVGLIAVGAWSWQDAQDKRRCRRAGGTVVNASGAEWRCDLPGPEVRP